MLNSILFLAGVGSVVAGVALVCVPAAFIVGGVALAALAVVLERGKPEPEPAESPDGDS